MNNNYKYLIWAGTGVLIILGIFLMVMISHTLDTATNTNTVSFNGEGKVFAKPDISKISFSILTEAKTSKAAQDSNSEKSKKVVDFLKSQGIQDKDIKTSGYNVYPQYSNSIRPCSVQAGSGTTGMMAPQPYPCTDNQQQISGYQVNQSFEVKVRDLDKVSTLLDGLVTAGANQVNNLGFTIDNIEAVKDQARELAIKDVKEKADTLKKQVGIRLGKIINFSEGSYYPGPYAMEAKGMGGGMGGGGVAPSIPSGENEITINVTITYQIK